MGHDFSFAGGMGDFTVTKSNPSGNIVKFTITDSGHLLTTSKMIRSVLEDAIDQFIAIERADLNTNGDSSVKGYDQYDPRHVGDGYGAFTWNFAGKYAQVTLTALTNIAATGTITVSIPYGDTV
jgi:hypothetical protein